MKVVMEWVDSYSGTERLTAAKVKGPGWSARMGEVSLDMPDIPNDGGVAIVVRKKTSKTMASIEPPERNIVWDDGSNVMGVGPDSVEVLVGSDAREVDLEPDGRSTVVYMKHGPEFEKLRVPLPLEPGKSVKIIP